MPDKKIKYAFDGNHNGHYVRVTKEGRGRNAEFGIQVWFQKERPLGEPDGDWGMPALLPINVAIDQAIMNTESDLKG